MADIKRQEIYYTDLRPIRGSEQDGVRPVLIIQNNKGNIFSPTTIVAPITSSLKKTVLPTHVYIQAEGLPKDSIVLLEQITTIDKIRLKKYIGELDDLTMGKVDQAIAISLGIKYLEALLE